MAVKEKDRQGQAWIHVLKTDKRKVTTIKISMSQTVMGCECYLSESGPQELKAS